MSTKDASGSSMAPEPASALFGADSRPELTCRWIVFFITFCLALAGLLALRRPDALLNPQFWAEDGNLLFAQQFYGEASLFKPYAGYLIVLLRLAAKFADLFPVVRAPLIYNLAALLLASICTAWFALPGFRHLIRDDKLRILACVLIALMPSAGTVLLNLTNLQWYLHLWCCLVCLQPFPGGKTRLALLFVYLLFFFSSTLAILLLPLWLLRAVLVKKDRLASLALSAVSLAYAILIKVWLAPAAAGPAAGRAFGAVLKLLISRVGLMTILGPKILEHEVPHATLTFLLAGTVGAILLLVLSWRARGRPRFPVQAAALAYLVFSSLALLVLVRAPEPPPDLYFTGGGARYFFLATALFYVGLLNVLDQFRSDRLVRSGAIGVLALCGFAAITNIFFVQSFEDLQWPRWAQGFEQARQSRARFPLDVPINPRPWVIPGSGRLPPDTLSLAVPLEPSSIERAEKINNSWRSVGSHAVLNFTLDQPRYVFALRLRYASTCPAQLAWRSALNQPFLHDAKLQLLPPAGADRTPKTVWIADGLQEFQIALGPSPCELELSEISLLASPHPLR
jgi:hypothetical protein